MDSAGIEDRYSMKLRFTALAFVLALMTVAVHAQVGLYFNPIISRVSNSTPDTGPFAFLGQGGTSKIFGGVDFGGNYTFLHQPNFNVGVDARDAIQHGDSASLNSFLVGVYVQSKPLAYGLKPYGQLSVGAGKTSAKTNPASITKLEYMVYGGVDKTLNKHVDFRAIEIGYGSVTTISSANFRSGSPIPATNLLSFSTGFVFHIP
jgi:hypothetical protein